MLRIKNFVALLLVVFIFLPNIAMVAKAENDQMSDDSSVKYELNNIKGVHRSSGNSEKVVETDDDLNYILDSVGININDNKLEIITKINDTDISFEASLYPSQFGPNASNTIVAIEDMVAKDFEILKFTIENNAQSNSLLAPNIDMAGKTVASFGIYNRKTLDKYYFQFVLDNFDFVKEYNTVSNFYASSSLPIDYLLDKEVAYFTLQPTSDFKASFQSINTMEFSDSSQTSSTDVLGEYSTLDDLKGDSIDQLIEMSKKDSIDLSLSATSLLPDIPDSLYKKQENGTWTNGSTAWTNGNKVGYTVYHMNDSFSGNALNYVLRYYISSRFNWSSQQFDTSFNLSHNIWVQYIKSSNSIFVFDDRASNARIIISPTIYLSVSDSNTSGYFNSKMTNAYKNGSFAPKLLELIIGYVPKLGTIQNIYKTLTNDNSIGNNSKQFFEMDYTRDVKAKMTNLKYAPNGRNYAQDYVGLTIWATNVNSITNGYQWTCYAN